MYFELAWVTVRLYRCECVCMHVYNVNHNR